MAAVLHCSCLFPRSRAPRLGRRTCTSDLSSGEFHVSGKLVSLPFRIKNPISSSRETSRAPNEMQQPFLGRPSMHLVLYYMKTLKSGGVFENGPSLPAYKAIVEHFAAHEAMAVIRIPAIALTVINALMLTMPFEALAETCEADESFLNMPLLLFVALIGATVGGLLARQRRGELQRVNEQLRQINAALRRQAKIESYAPTLSYAPVGGRILESEVIVDPRKQELISHLKSGKNFLRNQDPEKAFVEFKTALELAQSLKDPIEEKKAARGLGASLQRQGKYRESIKCHSMVLAISESVGEDSGNTEAYGAIADCYTELGDLEQAGKFYDKYIARLEKD